jgi:hypothetical protein
MPAGSVKHLHAAFLGTRCPRGMNLLLVTPGFLGGRMGFSGSGDAAVERLRSRKTADPPKVCGAITAEDDDREDRERFGRC